MATISTDPMQIAPADASQPPVQRKPIAPPTTGPTTGPTALPIAPNTPAQTPTAQPAGPSLAPLQGIGSSGSPTAQPIAPPPLSTNDPMAFAPSNGLPSGFTLGDPGGANWGNAYYGGQQVSGLGAGGIELADGSFVPNSNAQQFQQLQNAENANYQTPDAITYRLQQAGATSSDPSMAAVLQNPEYDKLLAQNGGQLDFQNLWSQASPELQALMRQSPMYGFGTGSGAQMLQQHQTATAGNGGAPIPQSDIDRISGLAQNGLPMKPPAPAGQQAAPTSGQNTNTLFNPMSLAGAGPIPAPTSPNDGSPSIGGGAGTIGGQSPAGGTPTSGPTPSGYSLTPTDPNNALTSQTIMPGPGLDFLGQAKQNLQDWEAQTQPQYDASLRDANRYAYANGRGQSGIANNSLGDLALQRENSIRSAQDQFLSNAMGTQNENNYRNIGVLQQQQGFQDQQQQQSFNNALQQLLIGSQGDPSQIGLILAQIFGSQSGQIGNAAGQYAQSQQQNALSQSQQQQFMQWLQNMQNGGGSGTPPIIDTLPPVETIGNYGYNP